MKNLSKNNASPLPLLRRPAPAPYFHFLFKIFQIPQPPGEVIKVYFPLPPPLFKKGRSELWRWTLGSDDLRVFNVLELFPPLKRKLRNFRFCLTIFQQRRAPKLSICYLLTKRSVWVLDVTSRRIGFYNFQHYHLLVIYPFISLTKSYLLFSKYS